MMKSSQRPVCIPSHSMMDEHGRPNQAMLHTRLLPNMLIHVNPYLIHSRSFKCGGLGGGVVKSGNEAKLLVSWLTVPCSMESSEE